MRLSLLLDGVEEEINHSLLIEMDWGEVCFVELISDLSCQDDFSSSLSGYKLLAPLGLVGYVLFDDLVRRKVDHIILDGQVGAGSVNTKSFLVIDDDNLW